MKDELIIRQSVLDQIELWARYDVPDVEAPMDLVGRILELPSINLPIKEQCQICPHCKHCDVDDDGVILPSAQLRPKGEWVYEKINSYTDRTYCSECGSHAPFEFVTDDHYGRHAHGEIRKTNFCPNCGADMRGADDD